MNQTTLYPITESGCASEGRAGGLRGHSHPLTKNSPYRFSARTSSSMVSVVVMMRELAWKARW
jgi:hypothetical protein